MREPHGTTAIAVAFVLASVPFLGLNGRRERGFTDATSYDLTCETQAEIDRYWAALAAGGEEGRCGRLKDRYGVSWPIVPRRMGELLGGADPAGPPPQRFPRSRHLNRA